MWKQSVAFAAFLRPFPVLVFAGSAHLAPNNGPAISLANTRVFATTSPTAIPITSAAQISKPIDGTLASLAALRANGKWGLAGTVGVSGYHTPGDLGAGVFTYVASDTNSVDNGGTIIVDAARRRWHRVNATNILTPQMFGAYCDNSHNDTKAVQAMAAAASNPVGNHILFPAGQCLINGTIPISQPATIEGVGGQAQTSGANAAIVQCSATADTFIVTTSQAVVFRNIGIRSCGGRTAGSDIDVKGDGKTQPIGFVANNVVFNNSYNAISIVNGRHWAVTECTFLNWGNAGRGDAIYYPSNTYPDSGDSYVIGNTFASGPTGKANHGYAAIYFESALGTYISSNKFFGAEYGIEVNAKNTTGDLQISNNSFEQQNISHIDIRQAGGTPGIGNITIVGNEFSQLTSVANSVNPTSPTINIEPGITNNYILNLVISSNVFNDDFIGNLAVVKIGDGSNNIVQGNAFNLYSRTAPGAIQVSNRATGTSVLDNIFTGMATSQHYKQGLLSSTVVRDSKLHFADVGTWANGSELYVVDGTPGATLSGSGSGAWARRINNEWNAN